MTERFVILDDGIRLQAALERPGEGRAPLVILLHGFTGSMESPHNLAASRAMVEAGFATLQMDLYGHGTSDGEFRRHTLHKWISNTLAALAWARAQGHVSGIYLSGHSQGGLVAALVGGMAPDVVKGLILRAPAFMIPRGAREGKLLGRTFDPLRVPEELESLKGLTLAGDYIRVAQTVHAEDAMDRFPGPVLIIHGDMDALVPVEESMAARDRYACCELAVIPGETHHFDRSPEQMQALIRDWLTRRRESEEEPCWRSC